MTKNVYSVRDTKTGFGPLMVMDNDAVAVRSFEVSVKQTDSLMHWCPADYALYYLGDFDDESGTLTRVEAPRFIVEAVAFVDKE